MPRRSFNVGDIVKGLFSAGQWYLATVEEDRGDGTYLVAWFDGDSSNRVKTLDELRLMVLDRETSTFQEAPSPGEEQEREATATHPSEAVAEPEEVSPPAAAAPEETRRTSPVTPFAPQPRRVDARLRDGICFYINLNRRTDRRSRMEELAAPHVWLSGAMERLAAVEGRELSWPQLVQDQHFTAAAQRQAEHAARGKRATLGASEEECSPHLTLGGCGCAMSHRNAWQALLKREAAPWALVLEDDLVTVCDDFDRELATVVELLPAGWHVCYLGFHTGEQLASGGRFTGPLAQLQKSDGWLAGLWCYLVSRAGAEALLQRAVPFSAQVDTVVGCLLLGSGTGFCVPPDQFLAFSPPTEASRDTDIQTFPEELEAEATKPVADSKDGDDEVIDVGGAGDILPQKVVAPDVGLGKDQSEPDGEPVPDEQDHVLQGGDRVEVVGHPEFAGQKGMLVAQHGNKWEVDIDGLGSRLLPSRSIKPLSTGDAEDAPAGGEAEESPDGFYPGELVKLVGLDGSPELNGSIGELLERHEDLGFDAWVVQLEGDEDARAVPTECIVKFGPEDDTYGGPWSKEWDPPPCYVLGSWDEFQEARAMNFDADRSCLQFNIMLDSGSFESFHVLMYGDADQRLYPDQPDADPRINFKICGPDNFGEDMNWTIGEPPVDASEESTTYEIRLQFGARDSLKVDWVQLGRHCIGAAEEPKKEQKKKKEANGPAMKPNPGTLKFLLQSAKPTWSVGTLDAVMEKLAKIEIESGLALVNILTQADDKSGEEEVNRKLLSVGEKSFTKDTMAQLSNYASVLENEIRWREGAPLKEIDFEQFRVDSDRNRPKVPEPTSLPVQRFRVVSLNDVFVRERPSVSSAAFGKKELHDEIEAAEQTFDGWARLHGEPGWVRMGDGGDDLGLGKVLEPLGEPLPLVISELTDKMGPYRFQTVGQGTGTVRIEPADNAQVLGFKHEGEDVLVETQAYNGWLRLSPKEPTKGGWMKYADKEHGKMLRCSILEEKQEKKSKIRMAREVFDTMEEAEPDMQKLKAAFALAKDAGMDRDERRAAEKAYEDLLKRQAKENQQKQLKHAQEAIKSIETGSLADAKTIQMALTRAKELGMKKEDLKTAEDMLQKVKSSEQETRWKESNKRQLQQRVRHAFALAEQDTAAATRQLTAALGTAKQGGFKEEAAQAEKFLAEVAEKEHTLARKRLAQRIESAAGNEKELQICIADAETGGFTEEAEMARRAITTATEEKKNRSSAHEELLKAVTAASASGDLAALKAARDAAKKAGVSMKDIGRAYSAGQNEKM